MNTVFVYDARDVFALGMLVLLALAFVALWTVSLVSLAWCKVSGGHRFRTATSGKCLKCGRVVA